jgi:predicted TIM-barrel fold metal-dependent hydrolase
VGYAAPLEKYLRWAAKAGIGRTAIFAAFHSDYAVANREVARIVASRPNRFYGLAFVHAAGTAARRRTGEGRDRTIWICTASRCTVYDARLSREICDVARAFSIPILYDPIGEVSIVELVATEYPDVAFIIPHMGSFSDDWRAQHSLIDYLVRHPNIYTDTSGVRRFELLEQAVQRAGAHKILFGSDGPWLHPGVELEKVRLLGLSPTDEQLVMGGNFLRLISKQREQPLALPQMSLAPSEQAPLQQEYRDPWRTDHFGA